MPEKTENIEIPEQFILDGKKSIKNLEELKRYILKKITEITEQNQKFELKLKKISSINKKIKINNEKKAATKKEFDQYVGALEKIVKNIETEIIDWNQSLLPETSPIKIERWEDLITFGIYLKRKALSTKQFVKKIKKDVSIAHSRFYFRFDIQEKQLNYLEIMSK